VSLTVTTIGQIDFKGDVIILVELMLHRNRRLHLDCIFLACLVGLIAAQPLLNVSTDSASVSFLELVEDQIDTESKEIGGSVRSNCHEYLAYNPHGTDAQNCFSIHVEDSLSFDSNGLLRQRQRGPPTSNI
jgi:hypothetical protein